MTAALSFWAGLAVGILSTVAAGAALWYGMLRYLRGMDPADLGRSAQDIARQRAEDALRIERDRIEHHRQPTPARGPVTDYAPGVVHHELTAETGPDGVTIYRRTQ